MVKYYRWGERSRIISAQNCGNLCAVTATISAVFTIGSRGQQARAHSKGCLHLENVNNIDMPTDLTSPARSTISSILEPENSNADDRSSTPRGKVISPKGAQKCQSAQRTSPSLVPEFDMSAFGGFGGVVVAVLLQPTKRVQICLLGKSLASKQFSFEFIVVSAKFK